MTEVRKMSNTDSSDNHFRLLPDHLDAMEDGLDAIHDHKDNIPPPPTTTSLYSLRNWALDIMYELY